MDGCLYLWHVAYVSLLGVDVLSFLLNEIHRLLQIVNSGHPVGNAADLLAAVDGDDIGALFSETPGMRAALARAAPVTRTSLSLN
jgi:hypothetical protein